MLLGELQLSPIPVWVGGGDEGRGWQYERGKAWLNMTPTVPHNDG